MTILGTGLVSARGPMALGLSTPGATVSGDLADITAMSGGNKPATWTLWVPWGSSNPNARKFPTAAANEIKAAGMTPMIWWQPATSGAPEKGWFPRYLNTWRGRHDDYIRQFAKDAKAYGGTVILRYAQEMNGHWFPWSVHRFDNNNFRFKKAWRRVWRLFKGTGGEGATNVKFLWSPTQTGCSGCNQFAAAFPGDKFVDYVGFTAFNRGGPKWKSMMKATEKAMNDMGKVTRKKVIIAELGSGHRGGSKANWIKHGYRKAYERWRRLKAIVYLNHDGRQEKAGLPDWRLEKPPDGSAWAAYAAIASQPRFQGSFN